MMKTRDYLRLNVLLTNKPLLKQHEFNVTDIKKHYDVVSPLNVTRIDQMIADEYQKLYDELIAEGVERKVIDILFVRYNILSSAPTITMETDYEILEYYASYDGCEAGVTFAKMTIDFYYLTRLLRKQVIDQYRVLGTIDEQQFQQFGDIERLIRNSGYYKSLKNIDRDHFEYQFDQALIDAMRPYRFKTIGVDSVFAYAFFKIMELKNVRIVLKGSMYHMNVEPMVRQVYV